MAVASSLTGSAPWGGAAPAPPWVMAKSASGDANHGARNLLLAALAALAIIVGIVAALGSGGDANPGSGGGATPPAPSGPAVEQPDDGAADERPGGSDGSAEN